MNSMFRSIIDNFDGILLVLLFLAAIVFAISVVVVVGSIFIAIAQTLGIVLNVYQQICVYFFVSTAMQ